MKHELRVKPVRIGLLGLLLGLAIGHQAHGHYAQSPGGPVPRWLDGAGNQMLLTNRNGKVWQFQYDSANIRLRLEPSPLTDEALVNWAVHVR